MTLHELHSLILILTIAVLAPLLCRMDSPDTPAFGGDGDQSGNPDRAAGAGMGNRWADHSDSGKFRIGLSLFSGWIRNRFPGHSRSAASLGGTWMVCVPGSLSCRGLQPASQRTGRFGLDRRGGTFDNRPGNADADLARCQGASHPLWRLRGGDWRHGRVRADPFDRRGPVVRRRRAWGLVVAHAPVHRDHRFRCVPSP